MTDRLTTRASDEARVRGVWASPQGPVPIRTTRPRSAKSSWAPKCVQWAGRLASKDCAIRRTGRSCPPRKPPGGGGDGDPQRLTDTEQLEILALLEAASTENSAMRAARALADLMRHLHALGRRIAVELPDQDRDGKPAGR
jgi:hypothetical protein